MIWQKAPSTSGKKDHSNPGSQESRSPSFSKSARSSGFRIFSRHDKVETASSFPKTTASSLQTTSAWGSTRSQTEKKRHVWDQPTSVSSWGKKKDENQKITKPSWAIKKDSPREQEAPKRLSAPIWKKGAEVKEKSEEKKEDKKEEEASQAETQSKGRWEKFTTWKKEKKEEQKDTNNSWATAKAGSWPKLGKTSFPWNKKQAKSDTISASKEIKEPKSQEMPKQESIWTKKKIAIQNKKEESSVNIFQRKSSNNQSQSRYSLRSRDKPEQKLEPKKQFPKAWAIPINQKTSSPIKIQKQSKVKRESAIFKKKIEELSPIKEVGQGEFKKPLTPKENKQKNVKFLKDVSFSLEQGGFSQQQESPRFLEQPQREQSSSPDFGGEEIEKKKQQTDKFTKISALPPRPKEKDPEPQLVRMASSEHHIGQYGIHEIMLRRAMRSFQNMMLRQPKRPKKLKVEKQKEWINPVKKWMQTSLEQKKSELFKRKGIQKLNIHKHLIAPQDIKISIDELVSKENLILLNIASGPCFNPESVLKYYPIKNINNRKKSPYSSSYSQRFDPIQSNKLRQREIIFGKLGMFSLFDQSVPTCEIKLKTIEIRDPDEGKEIQPQEIKETEKVVPVKTIEDTMGLLITEQLKNYSQLKIMQDFKEKLRRDRNHERKCEDVMKGVVARLLGY